MIGEKIYEKLKQWKNKIFIISLILNVVLGGLLIFSVSNAKESNGVTERIDSLRLIHDRDTKIQYDLARELEIRKRITSEREFTMAARQDIIREREGLQSSNESTIGSIQVELGNARDRIDRIRRGLQELSTISE